MSSISCLAVSNDKVVPNIPSKHGHAELTKQLVYLIKYSNVTPLD